MKFMRKRAPDISGLCFYGSKLQSTSFKNTVIGLKHILIFFKGIFGSLMKTISIFHQKFSPSHESKPGPGFIPKLCLNLIQMEGQLFIRLNKISNNIRNHFFMRRAQTKISFISIFEPG